ncbi:TPA: hypothetical protein ACT5CJ_002436, partial [Flavobacterium psychrophilum]
GQASAKENQKNMKLSIGNHKVRITHNDNNRFWKSNGIFRNISEIKIDKEWWRCYIRFEKNEKDHNIVTFINPMKMEGNSSAVKEYHTEGIYTKIKISSFKVLILKFLLNEHSINYSFYKTKKNVFDRKNTFFVFSIATILSLAYYFINLLDNNSLMKYISENIWIQTIIIFLTISGFINIFHPFTIRKELNVNDVESISKVTYEKTEIEKKQNEENIRNNSF